MDTIATHKRTTVAHSNCLADLAARIRAEHEACDAALKRGLQHAVAAGKMLIEAKEQLKHGQWLPWLRDQCGIPERSARRYMEIAPYAADQIGQLADLTADAAHDAIQALKPLSDEWFRYRLDGPFTEADTDNAEWVCTKLAHQVEVPPLVSVLLTADDRRDLKLLRLCSFDDLEQTAIALAPIATSKKAVKINADTITALQGAVAMIVCVAKWMLGGVLTEIERRCQGRYTEEQYQREWRETHAAWMASMEARLADQAALDSGRT
jgi:hypothetical protein